MMPSRDTVHAPPVYKSCSNCDARWASVDAFIEDPAIALVGYMPAFDELANGLFLFNHHCGTTLACHVWQFTHLYNGPIYRDNKHGGDECPGHCLNQSELSPCPTQCCCAFVRETLHTIRRWPKADARQ